MRREHLAANLVTWQAVHTIKFSGLLFFFRIFPGHILFFLTSFSVILFFFGHPVCLVFYYTTRSQQRGAAASGCPGQWPSTDPAYNIHPYKEPRPPGFPWKEME